jgi:AcrR family transcriptional regulator
MGKPGSRQEQASDTTGERRVRGRSKRLDEAIRAATLHLLVSAGPAGVSIDAVAREVGCSRSSLYRRHASKDDLIMEAALGQFESPAVPDGSSLLDWVASSRAALFSEPASVLAMTWLMAEAVRGTELGRRYLGEVFGPIRRERTSHLLRAIASGEIKADIDASLIQDMIAGTMLFRAVHHPEPEADLAERITVILRDGVSPRPACSA